MEEMRGLLLTFGAKESEFEVERWKLRQRADACERARIQKEKDILEVRHMMKDDELQ